MDAYDSHLVLSFVGETRLLAISEEDVLDEAVIPGFDGDSQTLLAATTLHDHLLQVRLVCGWVGVGWCWCMDKRGVGSWPRFVTLMQQFAH